MSTYYLIGIGGVGMSYVARFLASQGHTIVGADAVESSTVQELREEGITIHIGHDASQLPEQVDAVLMSPAVAFSKPADYQEAQSRGLPVHTWQEFLGDITKDYITIAVCGAHGKSTTTAMMGILLEKAGLDPTIFVGTKLKEFNNRNIKIGSSKYLIIEADEFYENFLNYHPTYILCTSFEVDHLDYYKSKENYHQAFESFFRKLQEHDTGRLYHHKRDTMVTTLAGEVSTTVVTDELPFNLSIPGVHNRENAMLCYALGKDLGLTEEQLQEGLQAFQGTWRRQELIGTFQGAVVYDDYAHHPTEVRSTIAALKEAYPEEKLTVVFQPHQYSRTLEFFEDFATCFEDADEVYITDIYESRDSEEVKQKVSAELLVKEAALHHHHINFSGSLEMTKTMVEENVQGGVLAFLGAGTISTLARDMVSMED